MNGKYRQIAEFRRFIRENGVECAENTILYTFITPAEYEIAYMPDELLQVQVTALVYDTLNGTVQAAYRSSSGNFLRIADVEDFEWQEIRHIAEHLGVKIEIDETNA